MSSASAAHGFPANTAIPIGTCDVLLLAPLFLFPPQGDCLTSPMPSRNIRFQIIANRAKSQRSSLVRQKSCNVGTGRGLTLG